jgi:hypothetical protein
MGKSMEPVMKSLRSFAAAVALAATSFGPAYAADPLVLVDVDPVPVKVTFSRTNLTTFAAFVGSISNTSGRTLNRVRFEATPTVYRDGNMGLIAAPFVSGASSPGCTSSAGKVTCELGQMTNGQSRSLVLVLQAPLAPTTPFAPLPCSNTWNPAGPAVQSPGSPTNCDRIDLAWAYIYSEGTNDNPNQSSHTDSTPGLTFTALGTPTGTQVWSWVTPGGTTFFTGNQAIAGTLFDNVPDLATTKVFVPATWNFPANSNGVVLRTAQIDETETAGSLTSTLTVPGNASGTSYMEITLRRDASTIPSGFQLRDWVITYQHTLPDGPVITPQLCSKSTTAAPLPRSGVPCEIDGSRIAYKNNNAPTPAFVGDYEARFRAFNNGRFGTQ